MKVYLASWFASKEDMRARANLLREQGIEVTSRWIEEKIRSTITIQESGDEYLRETAAIDIEDVLMANYLVLNVPSDNDFKTTEISLSSWARGGRHFESGFQYALMMFLQYLPPSIRWIGPRGMILVGHQENIFHYLDGVRKDLKSLGFDLPVIPCFPTWEEASAYLVGLSKTEELASKR